jgi:hypothetical protein
MKSNSEELGMKIPEFQNAVAGEYRHNTDQAGCENRGGRCYERPTVTSVRLDKIIQSDGSQPDDGNGSGPNPRPKPNDTNRPGTQLFQSIVRTEFYEY